MNPIYTPLVYNSDIKTIEGKSDITPDEFLLIHYKDALETKIQQACNTIFQSRVVELEIEYGCKVAEFVQIDNGADLTKYGKIRKAKEGTKRGIPDVCLFLGTPCGQYSKVILVEFKRIGTPSKVIIGKEQQYYHDWFNAIGFKSYITNNPLYFKNVIMGEVDNFFKEIK